MSRSSRVVVVICAGVCALGVSFVLGGSAPDIVLLTLGVVVGDLLVLHPLGAPRVPASHAVVLVTMRNLAVPEFLAVCAVAFPVAAWLRGSGAPLTERRRVAFRLATACTALGAYHAVLALAPAGTAPWVLASLGAAALIQMVADELVFRFRGGAWLPELPDATRGAPIGSHRIGHRSRRPAGRAAALAVATSGVLMALVSTGVDGRPGPGRWSALLLAVPLVAALAADHLVRRARRNYTETIDALAAAPELGGHVAPGSTDRVTELSRAVGESLDLDLAALEDLEAAARLHRLGSVCLDADVATDVERHTDRWRAHRRAAARTDEADATAHILAADDRLDRVGAVVWAAARPHRRPRPEPSDARRYPDPPGAAALRVAVTYEELTRGDDGRAALALERMYSGPAYMFGTSALGALEQVLGDDGRLEDRPEGSTTRGGRRRSRDA
ncbi:MAG: hypothetical protein R3A49_06900 [Acidimicrobiia bacterium]